MGERSGYMCAGNYLQYAKLLIIFKHMNKKDGKIYF